MVFGYPHVPTSLQYQSNNLDYLVIKAKNPSSLEHITKNVSESDLIKLVYENSVLKQISKAVNGSDLKLFRKNQKLFLNVVKIMKTNEKIDSVYENNYKWFLNNNPGYAEQFRDMDYGKWSKLHSKNLEDYKLLCSEMKNNSPKYEKISTGL